MSTWASDRYKILEQEAIMRGEMALPQGWKFWILDEAHNPVATDMQTWMEWSMEFPNRVVKQEEVGDARVSTVLLLDMGVRPTFETMVFRGEKGDEVWQCHTWEEALTQHEMALRWLQEGAL